MSGHCVFAKYFNMRSEIVKLYLSDSHPTRTCNGIRLIKISFLILCYENEYENRPSTKSYIPTEKVKRVPIIRRVQNFF